MKQLPIDELVLDYSVYPRNRVDPYHVDDLVRLIGGGATLPPVIVDRASRRVVDGFHRTLAHKELNREVIVVEIRDYADDAELYLDAIRLNAAHGLKLGRYDQVKIVTHAIHDLHIDPKRVASALGLTSDRVADLSLRVAYANNGAAVPLKGAMLGFKGRHLTEQQVAGMAKVVGGRGGVQAVESWLNWIRSDLLDFNDPEVQNLLETLVEAIEGKLALASHSKAKV